MGAEAYTFCNGRVKIILLNLMSYSKVSQYSGYHLETIGANVRNVLDGFEKLEAHKDEARY